MRDAASTRQVEASDPGVTTWLSANAGSGKTRVLTDRVARLLLAGVQPQHILCLTYTKAAATEMQNRLFRLLGEWAMKPDAALHAALRELGTETALAPETLAPETLAAARRLFARAIEAPGGLRIQTIHSFCATLLRRFPLESGVSPQFTELDDRAARLLRAGILEELADGLAPEAVAAAARAYTGDEFTRVMEQVAAQRGNFAPALTEPEIRALFHVPDDETAAGIVGDVFLGGEAGWLGDLGDAMLAGSPTDLKMAAQLAAMPLATPDLATVAALENLLLTGAGAKAPYAAKVGSIPTKDTRAAVPHLMRHLEALMLRVEAARPRRLALQAAGKTQALHQFAQAFLPVYAARKAARGWLDFDDLIARAKALLTDRSVAAWVLYRLDGGIDHILVDEAQDTSPDQWRIIELLTSEFTAGFGTRQGGRTLFVVGDKKQSIYSFQGADIAAFDEKHATFRTRFHGADLEFQSRALEHSFRSAPAILQLVDTAFARHFPDALGDLFQHIAFKDQLPGRVDLWQMIEPVRPQKDENWEDPVDLIAETHHAAQLARQIASEIKGILDSGTRIPSDAGPRAVHAGDFLILVQSRSPLFAEIIRACKKLGLPIAGADRLKLGAELAVKDLAALLSFLATPEDDLSLAALLRSPLCGWSEAEVFALAQPRQGYLWEALRAHPGRPETTLMLQDLRNSADFLRPFDLVERVLTRHDGRRRLLTRLGPEAEDGIDAFLSQALAYERLEVPSLTGFLIWLETDDITVKRQMDSEGTRIRVMTVHGAKGLEAPIVILPDTADRKPRDHDEIYVLPHGAPVWKVNAEDSPPQIARVRTERKRRDDNESIRLLYVALTRARCWLIVAGAGEARTERKAGNLMVAKERIEWCWYRQIEAGMAQLPGVVTLAGRRRFATGDWPADVFAVPSAAMLPPELPGWLPVWASTLAPAPLRPRQALLPSDLGGAKALAGEDEGAVSQDEALARGTALHRLLEHLAGVPRAEWAALAARLIPGRQDADDLLAEASAVLNAADLADIFAPGSLAEVPFAADLHGQRLTGSIDRLIITPECVTAIDFKSNRVIPPDAAQIPEGLLRQMGAYAHGLGQIFPDHRIETAILWTRTAQLMRLDPDIVRAALLRTAIP